MMGHCGDGRGRASYKVCAGQVVHKTPTVGVSPDGKLFAARPGRTAVSADGRSGPNQGADFEAAAVGQETSGEF
jgi:hypothetical protein